MFSKWSFLCLVVFVFLHTDKLGHAIDLVITPPTVTTLFSTNPTLSCSPAGLLPSSILYIKLTKPDANGEILLAIVSANNYLHFNNHTDDGHEIQVTGGIDHTHLENSYLNVTLVGPSADQSGAYRCDVRYINEDGVMQSANTMAELTVKESDLTQFEKIVTSLRDQLDRLKDRLENNDNVQILREKINQLTSSLDQKNDETRALEQVIQNLKKDIKELHKKSESTDEYFAIFKNNVSSNISQHTNTCETAYNDLKENVTNELKYSKHFGEQLQTQGENITKTILSQQNQHDSDFAILKHQLETETNNTIALAIKTTTLENENTKLTDRLNSLNATLTKITETKCPDKTWSKSGDDCYKVFETFKTSTRKLLHYEASAVCLKNKGQLLEIHDAATIPRVKSALGLHNAKYWIGLSRTSGGGFVWDDGRILGSYKPWASGMPRAKKDNYSCVVVNTDTNKWEDSSCSFFYSALCQAKAERV